MLMRPVTPEWMNVESPITPTVCCSPLLAHGLVKAVKPRHRRAHAQSGIHGAQGCLRAQGIAADIADDRDIYSSPGYNTSPGGDIRHTSWADGREWRCQCDSTGFSGSPKAFATVFWENSPRGGKRFFPSTWSPRVLQWRLNDAVQLLHHHQAVYLLRQNSGSNLLGRGFSMPSFNTLTLSPKTSFTY